MDHTIECRRQLGPPTESLEVARREVAAYCYRRDDGLLLLLLSRSVEVEVACLPRSVADLWEEVRMMLTDDNNDAGTILRW